jgi:ornithine cyclodeaminase/alanine dehydrogenase-like protein (mu-crystallin family)
MEILVLSQAQVEALLPMAECVDAVAEALRALSAGEARLPLRTIVPLPDGSGLFGAMPAWLGRPETLGIKVITVFPGNEGSQLDSHQGAVLLFDTGDGRLLAVLDASAITAIRTAAASGVATRALAREGEADLALLGAGVQALTHLEAMRVARPLGRVRVWSRSAERAHAFVRAAAERLGETVEAVGSAEDAVRGASLVCTVTSSREPVLRGEWLEPGAHVNAVGASQKTSRELDAEAVRRARLFVDRRESALAEAGDFLQARDEGAVGDEHIAAELGEVLLGSEPGRRSPWEITLFKSVGLAVEDLAAAGVVYRAAVASGIGTSLELGGARRGA